MTDREGGDRDGTQARAAPKDDRLEAARAAKVLESAEAALGVVIRDIPLDEIEPDPAQPRRVFDDEKLWRLAASIRRYGLLQEPGVVALEREGGSSEAVRYRLIWGERRWRASRLAGVATLRCKVLARADGSAVEQLRMKEQQWAENMEREGLSPIEEAIAIQDAADFEGKLRPGTPAGEIVERIAEGRGINGIVARNLVALLKTPRSLQSAIMARAIGREVGFELARFWNKLLADNELRGEAKREIQYRNLVQAWARARGAELDPQAMGRYASETFQDPKVVKATCRKAEESQRAVVERFDAIVARAEKETWTVAKAKAELSDERRGRRRNGGTPPPCFEQGGKGNSRLTVHLDRVRDRAVSSPDALGGLLDVLRELVREIEGRQAESGSASRGE